MKTLVTAPELFVYERQTLDTRARLRAALAQLPSRCAAVALKAHEERVRRFGQHFSWGEIAPWILADVLGADPDRVSPVAVGWLEILLAILMLDDVVDRHVNDDHAGRLIVSELLIQRGLTELLRCTSEIQGPVDAIFARTAEAAVAEIQDHRAKTSSYRDDQLALVGQKLAMLELCEVAIRGTLDRNSPQGRLGEPLKQLCLGVQLLDDIGDLAEDYSVQNFTLPLARSIRKGFLDAGSSNVVRVSPNELLARVVRSGALEEALEASRQAFTQAIGGLRDVVARPTAIGRYLDRLARELTALTLDVRNTRIKWEQSGVPATNLWTTWVEPDDLQRIQRRVEIVAQSS